MPLQTTHRPPTLDDFAGNQALKESLGSVLARKEDMPHTFFFRGPSGCGKTTLARIVGHEVECHDWDFHYFNASNTRGIDTVRQVISEMRLHPAKGNCKVYCFDECHQLTQPAQEAFLKETEEPPNHVYFIFCTTEPEKMKQTFKRRAFIGEVKPLTRSEIIRLLRSILAKEKVEDYPQKVLQKIAMSCDGSPGMALNLLDSVIDITDDELAFKAIEESTISESGLNDLCRIMLDPRTGFNNKWEEVRKMLKVMPGEPESIRRGILNWMTKAILSDNPNDAAMDIMMLFLDSFFYSGKAGLVAACYLACATGEK